MGLINDPFLQGGLLPQLYGRRLLILSSGTGGGHDSVATAIVEAVHTLTGGRLRVQVVAPLGRGVERMYAMALNYAPGLWGLGYHAGNVRAATSLEQHAIKLLWGKRVASLLDKERPDLILSVHALCAQAVDPIAHMLGIPHQCVITDLVDIHRTWSAPGVATYFVPTLQAKLALLRRGVERERIQLTGLPVRRAFWHGPTRSEKQRTRGRLQVLVMDGGRPGPALAATVRTLVESIPSLAMSVAWGGASPIAHELRSRHQSCAIRHLDASAEIAKEMRIADVVVTKAGSVTIAEALATGRPLVLHRAAPGQEESNPDFVQALGAGVYAPNAARLCEMVTRLIEAPEEQGEMALCAAAAGRPTAAQHVALHILLSLTTRATQTVGAVG